MAGELDLFPTSETATPEQTAEQDRANIEAAKKQNAEQIATGGPLSKSQQYGTPDDPNYGGEGGGEPGNTDKAVMTLTDPGSGDDEFMLDAGTGAAFPGKAEGADNASVDLTYDNFVKGASQQLDALKLIITKNAASMALANGDIDGAIQILGQEAQKVVGPKPGVSRGALDAKIKQGPGQMVMPDFPAKDKQIIARLSAAAFASFAKSMAMGMKGGQSALVGGMVVDPGTKIMSETGKMLAADVQKYEDRAQKVRDINFALNEQYKGDVLKMQADFEARSDANDRAYMSMIRGYVGNKLNSLDQQLNANIEKRGAIAAQVGAVKDATLNKEQEVNAGFKQQTSLFNVGQRNHFAIAQANFTQNELRIASEMRKRRGDVGEVGRLNQALQFLAVDKNSGDGTVIATEANNFHGNYTNADNTAMRLGGQAYNILHRKAADNANALQVAMDDMKLNGAQQKVVAAHFARLSALAPNKMTAQDYKDFAFNMKDKPLTYSSKQGIGYYDADREATYPYFRELEKNGLARWDATGNLQFDYKDWQYDSIVAGLTSGKTFIGIGAKYYRDTTMGKYDTQGKAAWNDNAPSKGTNK